MYLNIYIYLMMFIMCLFMLVTFYEYILLTLISLEFVMISTLMMLYNILLISNNMMIILFYLVFVVCESVLGLTVLIILIRSYGNNSIKLLNLNLW